MRNWDRKTLKRAREYHKMTQAELATLLDITLKSVNNLEGGRTPIDTVYSLALSQLFGKLRPYRFTIPELKVNGVICDLCGEPAIRVTILDTRRYCDSCRRDIQIVLLEQQKIAYQKALMIVKKNKSIL